MATTGAIGSYPYQNYYEMMTNPAYNPLYWGCLPQNNSAQSTTSDTKKGDTSFGLKRETTQVAKSSNWGAVGLTAAVTATGLIAAAARKGGGIKTENLKKGFSELWNSTKKTFNNASEKVKDFVKEDNKFTFTQVGNKQVCTVPKHTNIMHGNTTSTGLSDIGAEITAPKLERTIDGVTRLNKNIVLRSFEFPIKINGNNAICKVLNKKGNYKIVDLSGKTIEEINEATHKSIKDKIAAYAKGENIADLKEIVFSHKENGISRLFKQNSISDVAELKGAASDKFNVHSKTVANLRLEDENVNNAITKWLNGDTNLAKIFQGEHTNSLGVFTIKEGKIINVKINGTTYNVDSEKFKELYKNNKTTIDNILKLKSLENPVYTV